MRTAIIIKGDELQLLNNPQHLRIIKAIRADYSRPPYWHTTIKLTAENEREFAQDVLLPMSETVVITLLAEAFPGQLQGVLARYGYNSTTITIDTP